MYVSPVRSSEACTIFGSIMKNSKIFYFCIISAIVLALLTPEVDGRRKILRGRKTITRTYYKAAVLPAWSVIILVGLGEIIMGALMYLVMRKFILDPPITATYAPPPHVTS